MNKIELTKKLNKKRQELQIWQQNRQRAITQLQNVENNMMQLQGVISFLTTELKIAQNLENEELAKLPKNTKKLNTKNKIIKKAMLKRR